MDVDTVWEKLVEAGRDPVNCHAQAWQFLRAEHFGGLEVALVGATGGPHARGGWCHAHAPTLGALQTLLDQATAWQPDGYYVRLNPAYYPPAGWVAMSKDRTPGDKDIPELRGVFIDVDVPKGSPEAFDPAIARRCLRVLLDIIALADATCALRGAIVFTGRGVAAWLHADLPPDEETKVALHRMLAGFRAHVDLDSCIVDATSLTRARLVALPGVWKRKWSRKPKASRMHVPYARTAIVIREGATLTTSRLAALADAIGVDTVITSDDEPSAARGTNLRAAVNKHVRIDTPLHALGYYVQTPDCPCCDWLGRNGIIGPTDGGRGGAVGGVKHVGGKLYCHHDSCRDHKGGARPMSSFDIVALHMFGTDRLSLEQLRAVEQWFVERTDVLDRVRESVTLDEDEYV